MRKIITYLLILLIGINVLYVLSGVLNFSTQSIDVISIWLYKAKGFYYSEMGILEFLKQADYSHPQYPILLPYLFYLIFKLNGNFNEMVVLLFYPVFYTLILILCYRTLIKLKVDRIFSLVLTYCYSMLSPLLAMGGRGHAGEADIFIVFGFWMVVNFAINYIKEKKIKWLYFILLTAVVASNIKAEGVLISAILLFLPLKKINKFIFIALSLAPLLIWNFIRQNYGIEADLGYAFLSIQESLRRTAQIFILSLKELLNIRNWYILWPILVLTLFIKTKSFLVSVVNQTLCAIGLLFFTNYLFSNYPPELYVPSSIDRLLLQLSPLWFTVFALKLSFVFSKITLNAKI